jgi:hypothetical protein
MIPGLMPIGPIIVVRLVFLSLESEAASPAGGQSKGNRMINDENEVSK